MENIYHDIIGFDPFSINGHYYNGTQLDLPYYHRRIFGEGFSDLPMEVGGEIKGRRRYKN